jgi:outer membrane autotransporter protein
VEGAPIARDTAVLEVEMNIAMKKNISMGLAYIGQLSHKTQAHSAQLNFSWAF